MRRSNDAGYVVAVGGEGDNGSDNRLFRFRRESPIPNYWKLIPALPSQRGISVSSNGSIFAISYESRIELTIFDMNIQPYGPNSIRNIFLPTNRVSMSMSPDGRYIFIGTSEGVFVYEYLNNALSLRKQYTQNNPLILDIASSADGHYIVAVSRWNSPDNERSLILFFDNFRKVEGSANPWAWRDKLIVGIAIVITGTIGFILYKRKRFSRSLVLMTGFLFLIQQHSNSYSNNCLYTDYCEKDRFICG